MSGYLDYSGRDDVPPADWPDPVQRAFAHINPAIYVSMQGPSELGISADASLARR